MDRPWQHEFSFLGVGGGGGVRATCLFILPRRTVWYVQHYLCWGAVGSMVANALATPLSTSCVNVFCQIVLMAFKDITFIYVWESCMITDIRSPVLHKNTVSSLRTQINYLNVFKQTDTQTLSQAPWTDNHHFGRTMRGEKVKDALFTAVHKILY